jgi:peroxiredoxin
MKMMTLLTGILLTGITMSFKPVGPELSIGSGIPKADLKMKDVSGKEICLNDAKSAKGILVLFSCNTCPYVKLSETRIKEYSEWCKTNNMGCIIVNSNDAQRDSDDSFDAMKKYAADQKMNVPYVLDVKSELADAFGATRTPQCFLFDASGKLVYKGAIDDNVKDPAAVTKPYLKDALVAVSKGDKPAVQETKSIGCTIKRNE